MQTVDRQSYEGEHHRIARDMVDHLPGVWSYSDEKSRAYYAVLKDRGGHGIKVRYSDKRIVIVGLWPDPLPGHHTNYLFEPARVIGHGQENPRITCNPKRGGKAIARDVARRFLPKYIPLWHQMCDKREERLAEQKLEQKIIQMFLDAGGDDAKHDHVYLRYNGGDVPHGRVEIRVNYDEVLIGFDVSGIPLDTALFIMAELSDCRQAIIRSKRSIPPPAEPEPLRHLDGTEVQL